MATLVIVSGAPASGKTTLARSLAHALKLPMFSRDAIKEALFDTLGWKDRAWSRTLGNGSTRVLFELLEEALTAGVDCLAEGTFRPSTTAAAFDALLTATAADVVQVHCVADPEVLISRFAARVESGNRHPGHCDGTTLDEFRADLDRNAFTPLPIEGSTLIVDNGHPSDAARTGVIADVVALVGAAAERRAAAAREAGRTAAPAEGTGDEVGQRRAAGGRDGRRRTPGRGPTGGADTRRTGNPWQSWEHAAGRTPPGGDAQAVGAD